MTILHSSSHFYDVSDDDELRGAKLRYLFQKCAIGILVSAAPAIPLYSKFYEHSKYAFSISWLGSLACSLGAAAFAGYAYTTRDKIKTLSPH